MTPHAPVTRAQAASAAPVVAHPDVVHAVAQHTLQSTSGAPVGPGAYRADWFAERLEYGMLLAVHALMPRSTRASRVEAPEGVKAQEGVEREHAGPGYTLLLPDAFVAFPRPTRPPRAVVGLFGDEVVEFGIDEFS